MTTTAPTPDGPVKLPEPTSPAMRVAVVLHTHRVGAIGFYVALVALFAPVTALVGNTDFVDALLWNGDRVVRAAHFHQLVTTLVVSLAVGLPALVAAHVGKGPLAGPADTTTVPGQT
jgi:hypothetical protein